MNQNTLNASISRRKNARFAFLLLGLMVLATGMYLPSLNNSFVYDDVILLTRDQRVTEPGHLLEIWNTDHWPGDRPSYSYRPLTTTSYALCNAFGLNQRIANLLFHAGCTALSFVLAYSLGMSLIPSFLAGALFALHPLHSETLYLVVGRGELLAALFGFLFLIGSLRTWNSFALAMLYLAALLSKESAIMLPILAILLWQKNHPHSSIREVIFCGIRFLFIAFLPVALLFFLRYRVFGYMLSPEGYFDPLFNPLGSLPTGLRITNALWVQLLYIKSMLIPYPLRADYSFNQIELIHTLADVRAVVVFFFLGTLIAAFFKSRKTLKTAEFTGLLFILIALLPVSNILFTSGVIFGERLTYFPLFGFCLIIAGLCQRYCLRSQPRSVYISPLFTFVTLLVLLTYSIIVVERDREWQNENTFTAALVMNSPRSALAHGLRFLHLNTKGEINEAEKHLIQALQIYPSYYDAWDSYGDFLVARKQYARAAEAYARAAREVAKTPYDSKEAGIFYLKAAGLELQMGRCRQSINYLNNAANWLPKPYPPYYKQIRQQLQLSNCEQE